MPVIQNLLLTTFSISVNVGSFGFETDLEEDSDAVVVVVAVVPEELHAVAEDGFSFEGAGVL